MGNPVSQPVGATTILTQGAADAVRYRERSGAERANGRLKDEFGGRHIWGRGAVKVMSHLMFGILVLSVDQLLRLRQ
jgi:hypothetical protein